MTKQPARGLALGGAQPNAPLSAASTASGDGSARPSGQAPRGCRGQQSRSLRPGQAWRLAGPQGAVPPEGAGDREHAGPQPGPLLREGERADDLRRGGLKVIQHPSAPCFALDAVLLADFAQVKPGERVLDLGAGSGVISLLLAVKQPDCRIYALELMERMAEMASRSVALNNLEERIEVHCGDIARAAEIFGKAAVDVAVSNPPYYKEGAGRPNEDELFAAARSERYCRLDTLLDGAEAALKPLGRLYLVHRAARAGELLGALAQRSLHAERLRFVQPYADKPANLILLGARKGGAGETTVAPPLIVYRERGRYSAEMEEIYAGSALPGSHADR